MTVVVFALAALLVLPNMARGPFRNGVDVLWSPGTELGLTQNWYVFSPDPRDESFEVTARIEHADGTVELWEVPELGRFHGAYRQYRWRKFEERLRYEEYEAHHAAAAEWLAEAHRRDGELPRRVTFVERTRTHAPVGSPAPIDGEWTEQDLFSWERER